MKKVNRVTHSFVYNCQYLHFLTNVCVLVKWKSVCCQITDRWFVFNFALKHKVVHWWITHDGVEDISDGYDYSTTITKPPTMEETQLSFTGEHFQVWRNHRLPLCCEIFEKNFNWFFFCLESIIESTYLRPEILQPTHSSGRSLHDKHIFSGHAKVLGLVRSWGADVRYEIQLVIWNNQENSVNSQIWVSNPSSTANFTQK
jgi:hypothetical protein